MAGKQGFRGQVLRDWRDNNYLTLAAFAARLSQSTPGETVTGRAILNWERGQRPSARNLKKIVAVTGIPRKRFFNGRRAGGAK